MDAASRLTARDVRISVRPGPDAEFIQMRHSFDSQGDGNVLTIDVGPVYCLDTVRIHMEALVGPCVDHLYEAEVGSLMVQSEVLTNEGVVLETVELPMCVSLEHGGRVRPTVTRARL